VYASAVQAADHDVAVVWAGEGVDLINGIEPAGEIVRRLATEAVDRLRLAARLA
jgi:nitronate monooxygenase